MQKTYSLLRNNKQSGPYTLEELLQLSLKHFDLVWVEGKSSGWSYPSEIDTLKTYVDDIPKKAEEAIFQSQKSPDSTSATPAKTEIRTKKSTPVSSIAKHVYISLPAGAQKDRAFTPTISSETTEESADAKLERKALELRNKIQAFAANKNKPKDDNELDTKYSRPLDDIKEEYSSWLHQQQKQKKSFPKKPALIISGVGILLIGGYFIMSLFSDNKTTTAHILSAEEIKAAAPVFNETNKEIALEQKKLNSKRVTKSSGKNNSNKTKSLSKKFSDEKIQVD
jgi:hypothetical protein